MSDRQTLLRERLERVLSILERVPRRFAKVTRPEGFISSDAGIDCMDSICMVLIAAGEEFKKIDRITEGQLFAQYPQVEWRGVIGLRDVLAHGYFQADPQQLYNVCQDNIPTLIEVLRQMIDDLEDPPT
jgi:uncharacterized protein with HEPN domain